MPTSAGSTASPLVYTRTYTAKDAVGNTQRIPSGEARYLIPVGAHLNVVAPSER